MDQSVFCQNMPWSSLYSQTDAGDFTMNIAGPTANTALYNNCIIVDDLDYIEYDNLQTANVNHNEPCSMVESLWLETPRRPSAETKSMNRKKLFPVEPEFTENPGHQLQTIHEEFIIVDDDEYVNIETLMPYPQLNYTEKQGIHNVCIPLEPSLLPYIHVQDPIQYVIDGIQYDQQYAVDAPQQCTTIIDTDVTNIMNTVYDVGMVDGQYYVDGYPPVPVDCSYTTDYTCGKNGIKYSIAEAMDTSYLMNSIGTVNATVTNCNDLVGLCPVCNNVFQPAPLIQSSSYMPYTVCSCGTLIYLVPFIQYGQYPHYSGPHTAMESMNLPSII